jgi:hypothetical protein
MQRPKQSPSSAETSSGVQDVFLTTSCPTVVTYLTDTKWDDGSPRETSSISVTIDSGSIKVALNDRASKMTLYVTASDLRAALTTLEKAVTSGSPDWRKWNVHTKKK